MQRLHVLGVSEDGNALLLAVRRGAKSARFSIPVDDRLVDALDELGMDVDWDPAEAGDGAEGVEEPAPERAVRPTPSESRLSVREVQDRLRAGWSEEDVADLAGTTADWVGRFAVPIRAEQQRVIDRARDLTFSKARSGPSSRSLGESVAWNVAEKGVRLTYQDFDQSWSAYLAGDRWIIRFEYTSRGRPQVAEWELIDGELVSRNRLAATLAHVEPGRKRPKEVTPPEEDEVAPKPPASTRARRRSSKRGVPASAPDDSGDGDEPSSKQAPKKRAAKRKAPAKKRAAKRKAPAKKRAAKRKAPAKKRAAKRKAPAKKRPAKKKAPAKKRPGASSARRADPEERRRRAAERAAEGGRRPLRAGRQQAPPSSRVDAPGRPSPQVEAPSRPWAAADNGQRVRPEPRRSVDAPAGGSRPVFREGLVQVARVQREPSREDEGPGGEPRSGPHDH